MKKFLIILFAITGFSFKFGEGPEKVDYEYTHVDVNKRAFKKGEFLKYRIHYGFIDAGEITIEVKPETKAIGEKNAIHVVGLGYSKSTFDWFFKVRDRYETYIDEEKLVPLVFIRRVDEGGYTINQNLIFNHQQKKVDSDGKIFDTPENVQDVLSAFYYLRSIDFTNAKEGDIYCIPAFLDNEIFPIRIKFAGRETIKNDGEKIRCMKFKPVVQKGRVFKKEEDLKVWISDDANHIPIRAQCDILFGSLKMDLIESRGLAYEMAKVK